MRPEQPPESNYTVEFSEQFEADFDACYLQVSRISPKASAKRSS